MSIFEVTPNDKPTHFAQSTGRLVAAGAGQAETIGPVEGSLSCGSRWTAYVDLTKPRISTLVLVVVAVAAWSARWGAPDIAPVLHCLLGTALVAASSGAINQWLERKRDGRMRRTKNRPLPSGRLSETEVLVFGAVTLLFGEAYLAIAVNITTALLGLATWAVYVAVYTPLKARTPLNTHIGAVSGAMPVLMGWSAVEGVWDVRAAALFSILFLWQFPHFMAIAWIYRQEYARAGMKMLTVVDPSGRRAGRLAVCSAFALVPVSVLPAFYSPGATFYALGAIVLGVLQLAAAVTFFTSRDDLSARRLLHASLIYLPMLLGLLLFMPLI
jgi:protoheme IX farnesyltransferase